MGDIGGGGLPPGSVRILVRTFDGSDLTGLRHQVAACVAEQGLAGDPLDDFVLAVNELITNAVRHGGGSGTLRLWRVGARVDCEVSDGGAGIANGAHDGSRRPPPRQAGGWGLWLARELSGTLEISTSPAGTTVRISTAALPTD